MKPNLEKTPKSKNQSAPKDNTGESVFQFVDKRPKTVKQKKYQELANNSPQVGQLKAFQEMTGNHAAHQSPSIQRKSKLESNSNNKTGLPDQLKSGIENLSGYSMDDVKVHYNSNKPAQLKAHAYAQGTDIHLAAGQEKHLPHEAWHVVQQKQGRVKPTLQYKSKININDDAALEKEADSMGAKASQNSDSNFGMQSTTVIHTLSTGNTVQRLKNPELDVFLKQVRFLCNKHLKEPAEIEAVEAKAEKIGPKEESISVALQKTFADTSIEGIVSGHVDAAPLFSHPRYEQIESLERINEALSLIEELKGAKEMHRSAEIILLIWKAISSIPFKNGRKNLVAALPDSKLASFITHMGFANLVRELKPGGATAHLETIFAKIKAEIAGELNVVLLAFKFHQLKTRHHDASGAEVSDLKERQGVVHEKRLEIQRIQSAQLSEQEIEKLRTAVEAEFSDLSKALGHLGKEARYTQQDIEADDKHENTRVLEHHEIEAITDDPEEKGFQQYRRANINIPLNAKKERAKTLGAQLKGEEEKEGSEKDIRDELRMLHRDIKLTKAHLSSTLKPEIRKAWEAILKREAEIERLEKDKEPLRAKASSIAASIKEAKRNKSKKPAEKGGASAAGESVDPMVELKAKMKANQRAISLIDSKQDKLQGEIIAIKTQEEHENLDIEFEVFRLDHSKETKTNKQQRLSHLTSEIDKRQDRHQYLEGVQKSGLDSVDVLRKTVEKANAERDKEVEFLMKRNTANEKKYSAKRTTIEHELGTLLPARIKILESLLSKTEIPPVDYEGAQAPLDRLIYQWRAYYFTAVERDLVTKNNSEDKKLADLNRDRGRAISSLEALPGKLAADIEKAGKGAAGFVARLKEVQALAARKEEIPELHRVLSEHIRPLQVLAESQEKAKDVKLTTLQEYQHDFEKRHIGTLLKHFLAEADAAEAVPEQLLVLSNFAGFLGERMSEALLERMNLVLPRGFHGAIRDLRNRAVHFWDTHTLSALNVAEIKTTIGHANEAFKALLKLLLSESTIAFLSEKGPKPGKAHADITKIYTAIQKAALSLPRMELDFDANGGRKAPEPEVQGEIFANIIHSCPTIIDSIIHLAGAWNMDAHQMVLLFEEPVLGAETDKGVLKKRLQLEARLQALGQTIGNLQQIKETLPLLKERDLRVGDRKYFDLLQHFVAMIKEFRSAKTHSGFSNFIALNLALVMILHNGPQIKAALKNLEERVDPRNTFK